MKKMNIPIGHIIKIQKKLKGLYVSNPEDTLE